MKPFGDSTRLSIFVGKMIAAVGVIALSGVGFGTTAAGDDRPPSIIFILADDLGYGELGRFGQTKIRTPNLDRMADEGMRFTCVYAGSTVCAPSRCVLMTGRHTGHCHVRGNAAGPAQTLRPNDLTVAELLKPAGYATALIGKWGLGDEGIGGLPNDQGFDYFYGYLNQVHAHNYYPEFLWRDKEKVPLRNVVKKRARSGRFGAGYAIKKVDYSHDLFVDKALDWIDKTHRRPFFLYLALTIPHANNEATRLTGNGQEVPDYGIYADEDWPEPQKGQAAMITRMDRDVGRLIDRLKRHGIERNTLVIFSSDNGSHREGGVDPEFFDAGGPLRGSKRDLYEGGIRVPTLAWWPGRITPGSVNHTPWGFQDLMPTAAELAGITDKLPGHIDGHIDGVSIVPLLEGNSPDSFKQRVFYWEFYERGGKQAVRKGKWKAVRQGLDQGKIELYDLTRDLGETNNLAAKHPKVVKQMKKLMAAERIPHPNWKVRGRQPVRKSHAKAPRRKDIPGG